MASVFEQRRFYQENCPEIHQDMNCTNYAVRCPDGKGLIICRQVFPGVEVSINDFHAHRCLECYDDGDPFQLDFCCAGKFSCAFSEQESCVLEPGALAAHQCDRKNDVEGGFPLGHYRGVNLTIDFEQAADFVRRQFGVLTPDFTAIQKRILSESWLHVWRADTGCMAILRELNRTMVEIEQKLLQLKILELFFHLEHLEPTQKNISYFPKAQIELARQVRNRLINMPDSYISVEQLSREYQISSSQLQKIFKQYYGTSIYQYLRNHRLECAARALRETGRPVTEIALEAGFSNPGKFAGSFKERYGLTPLQYRQAQKWDAGMEQSY